MRFPPASASVLPKPSFIASLKSVLVSRQAGAKPARMPVNTEIESVNANTHPSSVTMIEAGSRSARNARISFTANCARSRPRAPPAIESRVVSVRICCTTRLRLAPKAVRMAISLRRASAFATNKFATFAQAMSRTNATAPNNTSSAGRMSPTIWSRSGTTIAPQPLSSSGYCCSRRREIVVISTCACLVSTCGFRRAITM